MMGRKSVAKESLGRLKHEISSARDERRFIWWIDMNKMNCGLKSSG